MKIILYKYDGLPNKINKSLPSNSLEISGQMVNELNIDSPTIKLTQNVLDYNYLYIEELNYYYWIKDYNVSVTGYYYINLEIDVLMSFKDYIEDSTLLIDYGTIDNISNPPQPYPIEYNTSINYTNPFKYNETDQSIIVIGLNTGG